MVTSKPTTNQSVFKTEYGPHYWYEFNCHQCALKETCLVELAIKKDLLTRPMIEFVGADGYVQYEGHNERVELNPQCQHFELNPPEFVPVK